MPNIPETLHRFTIFAELSPADLDLVAGITQVREYGADEQVFAEGTAADELFLLTKGKVAIKVQSGDGRQALFDQITAGELLGWSAMVEPRVYVASAWTTEPSEVLVVPAARLRELSDANKLMGYEIANGISQVIAKRFGQSIGRYGDVLGKDLRAFSGKEQVVWESGDLQLTTEAVLMGMATDDPDVIPLDALLDVDVEGDRVIFRAHGGDVASPSLDDPGRFAALVRDEMMRTRYAHRRRD
jgi:CRP/FNR family transcriptional regulator, cyclic AMP receptor protein